MTYALDGRTVDGIRLWPTYVNRSLVLRFASARDAEIWARDLSALDCEVATDGAILHVSGSHAVLESVVGVVTK